MGTFTIGSKNQPTKELTQTTKIVEKIIEVPIETIKEVQIIKEVEVLKEVPIEVVKYVDREVVKEVEKIVTKAVEVRVVDDKLTQRIEACLEANKMLKEKNEEYIRLIQEMVIVAKDMETRLHLYKNWGILCLLGLLGLILFKI